MTFQQVVEADTVSLTEASASSDLESTSSSDELADFPTITEQSSEEPSAPSEFPEDSSPASQEDQELVDEPLPEESTNEADLVDDEEEPQVEALDTEAETRTFS